MFTQLSGIEMIIYCAPTILTDNGFSTSASLKVAVALSGTYLATMIIGLSIIDHVGRRRLTLIMIPRTPLSLFVLGAFFLHGRGSRRRIPFVITCLVLFMFFNAGGLQFMGWLTGSEIYPLAVRGAGTSAQAATLWTTNPNPHVEFAVDSQSCRGRSHLVAVRAFQCRFLRVRPAENAGTDRP